MYKIIFSGNKQSFFFTFFLDKQPLVDEGLAYAGSVKFIVHILGLKVTVFLLRPLKFIKLNVGYYIGLNS